MPLRLERIPRWILAIGIIGTPVAGLTAGPLSACGFASGVLGSWLNYVYLQKAVASLVKAAAEQTAPSGVRLIAGMLTRLLALGLGSIVILKYSKISLIALMVGLFAPCFAICLEIAYELLWSTKSG